MRRPTFRLLEASVTLFRLLLLLMLAALTGYTAIVIANHGWNFFPTAFGDVFSMTWQKQFNVDFMGFLVLSAVWTAWRHHFSPLGIGLGVVAFFGGILFLSVYLLAVSFQVKGNAAALLLGQGRAAGLNKKE
jgi:hypothetical protein